MTTKSASLSGNTQSLTNTAATAPDLVPVKRVRRAQVAQPEPASPYACLSFVKRGKHRTDWLAVPEREYMAESINDGTAVLQEFIDYCRSGVEYGRMLFVAGQLRRSSMEVLESTARGKASRKGAALEILHGLDALAASAAQHLSTSEWIASRREENRRAERWEREEVASRKAEAAAKAAATRKAKREREAMGASE